MQKLIKGKPAHIQLGKNRDLTGMVR